MSVSSLEECTVLRKSWDLDMMDETLTVIGLSKMFVQVSWDSFSLRLISISYLTANTNHPVTSILLNQWICLKGFASRCARNKG